MMKAPCPQWMTLQRYYYSILTAISCKFVAYWCIYVKATVQLTNAQNDTSKVANMHEAKDRFLKLLDQTKDLQKNTELSKKEEVLAHIKVFLLISD
jgi:hypothetical protein